MSTMEENRNDGKGLGDAFGPGFPRVPSETDTASPSIPIRIANNN